MSMMDNLKDHQKKRMEKQAEVREGDEKAESAPAAQEVRAPAQAVSSAPSETPAAPAVETPAAEGANK